MGPRQGTKAERGIDAERLPRGRLLRLGGPELFRIGTIAIALLAVLGLRRPCADGMASLVTTFDQVPPDAAPAPLELERLSEEEIRLRFPGSPDAGPAAGAVGGARSPVRPAAP